MRRLLPFFFLILFLVLLVLPLGLRYLKYYSLGRSAAAEPPPYQPENVPQVATPAANIFADAPEVGQGIVLLDRSHNNDFAIEEISYLESRLVARGVELRPFISGDLAGALRSVNSFIIIAPMSSFDSEEIKAITNFVDHGGRLLLVGDPTRYDVEFIETEFAFTYSIAGDNIPLNSLAKEFEILYNGDYLYNTLKNEANYQNLVLSGESLVENGLTDGLEELAFYGSHSLQLGPGAEALLLGDEDTWSTATDRPGNLVLAATAADGNVLAIGDVNFLGNPYYTVFDNSHFIVNIADFLSQPERDLVLGDFPFFFNQPIDLIYTGAPTLGSDAFDEIIALQEALKQIDRQISLATEVQEDHDALYVGLYNQAEDVQELLESAGIELVISPAITGAESTGGDSGLRRQIESDLGIVNMSGTALILLDASGGRQSVVVLAASSDGLENAIGRLFDMIAYTGDYALADCVLQDSLALCPTNISDEPVENELISSGPADVIIDGGGDSGDGGGQVGEYIADIDAYVQDQIGVGDSVDGSLGLAESHAWMFGEGPTTIDIVAEGSGGIDLVLQVFDSDYNLVIEADSTFTDETETVLGLEIADDGTYYIVVRDYFEEGGDYVLSVAEGTPGNGDSGEGAIFVYGDDHGVPAGTGFTGAEEIAENLSAGFEVTTWIASVDGDLSEGLLTDYGLVIWTSGNYRNVDALEDENIGVLFTYLSNGGKLLITGATPPFLEFGEEATSLGSLTSFEATDSDSLLTTGLVAGEIIALDQSYQTTIIASQDVDNDELVFVRGNDSDEPGTPVGIVSTDETFPVFLLTVPFTAMPADIQQLLLINVVVWAGLF